MTFRLFSVLPMLTTALIFAQPKYTAQEVLEHVRERYSSLDDASASFTQNVRQRFAKNEQTQNGTAKIKQGNKYRIETDDQKIISNGKTVWIVSLSSNQVLIDSYKENSRMFSPDKFLSGLPKDFSPTAMEEHEGLLQLTLEPKEMNAQTRQIKSLTAWVNPRTWIVEKIEFTDRGQNVYIISLADITFNNGLSGKEFEFVPTKEMKVIDMRNLK